MERASDLSRVELGAGITLWSNAILVLDRLGVGGEVRRRGAILGSFEQRNHRGRLLSRWPLDEMERRLGAPVCGINRPDLHAALVDAGGDCVRVRSQVTGFDQDGQHVSVTLSDGRSETGDVLIGADGIDSTIRAQLLGQEAPRHSGLTMWRANVMLDDADAPDVDFVIWWGAAAKFVVFRSGPGRISWEGIVTAEAGEQDPPGRRKSAILERFARFTGPVLPIIAATSEQAIFRPTCATGRPTGNGAAAVTLLGDAAHPMTFAVGQGAAQALEDALAIADALDGRTGHAGAALRGYERLRMARSAHFQAMAWRLARAGALRNPAAQAFRNLAINLTSPIAWRMQVKDMRIPA